MNGLRLVWALALAAVGSGCGPTVAPPQVCPAPEPPPPSAVQNGPVPALLKGHFVVETIRPKDFPAAPPQTYLLGPEEQKRCAFVRIVFSFEEQMMVMRYAALCVEPEDRAKNPIPLKWCATEAISHVVWDARAFELPVPSGSQSNVQKITSYAPGTGPSEAAQERTVWGCKFNLDAQRFEIVERTQDTVRLFAPKFDAEWVLKATEQPTLDPDDVVVALERAIHRAPPSENPPPSPAPKPPKPISVDPGEF
jgi:hypothetical protein